MITVQIALAATSAVAALVAAVCAYLAYRKCAEIEAGAVPRFSIADFERMLRPADSTRNS